MAHTFDPDNRSKFQDFAIICAIYKTNHDHGIRTDVICPKNLLHQNSLALRPIIVRFYGGGWIGGDSSGGHLSLSLALSHPEGIRAVTAAYPGIDTKSTAFFQPCAQPIFGLPTFNKAAWTDHVDDVRAQQAASGKKVVVSSDPRIDRAPLIWSCTQHGLFEPYLLPADRSVHILDRVEDGAKFPRGGVFTWHAAQDTVVPVEGTTKKQKLIGELDPELPFRVHTAEGEHGFDLDSSIEDRWISEGLEGVVAAWLA